MGIEGVRDIGKPHVLGESRRCRIGSEPRRDLPRDAERAFVAPVLREELAFHRVSVGRIALELYQRTGPAPGRRRFSRPRCRR